ncbi:protease [Sphingobacterium pedocola]|uniref:Protease n=1 Tax=Sphingobacterium pedocola TaxID=2082722 RepID=A0ABR9T6T4_9SPHI|nr:protease [Sphingobacterium pedocola]MBE8721048.1 protease [Sphingobacterium pedocola]
MNKLLFFAPAILLSIASSCNTSQRNTDRTDTVSELADTSLVAKLNMPPTISLDQPIEMTFTVYNPTDRVKRFCKWHTPFEKPFLSKYLDVLSSNGEEVSYLGAMAKRIMPPPAESYLSVRPFDSLVVTVDLTKGYDLKKPDTYSVRYNSESISGLMVHDSLRFTIK